jgi:STIP1 family protein 1
VRESRKAYELAVEQRSPSLASIAQHVLAAKKEAWEHRERERILLENETLRKTLSAIDGADYEDKEALKKTVEEVFAKADAERCRRREVPDYLVDQISFGVMVDPMVTKTGHSYERSTLLLMLLFFP